MLAIIKTGGKQYKVKEGDKLEVEKLIGAKGETVIFKEVLLIGDEKELQIGAPTVEGSIVEAKIVKTAKGDKVVGMKQKPKKREHTKYGHRQIHTQIEIVKIGFGDEKKAPKVKKVVEKKK